MNNHDDRDPVWDVVRGVGVLCVVAAHSVGAYVSRPLPGLLWPVYEPVHALWQGEAASGPAPGVTDFVFWTIRAFTVPMFFFVAGVFAWRGLERDGAMGFLRSRVKKLGVALLAGILLVMPLVYVVWVWGWVRYGYAAWEHLRHFHFGPAVQQNLHGFGHLWYLWYLLLMCVGAAGIRGVWTRRKGGNAEENSGKDGRAEGARTFSGGSRSRTNLSAFPAFGSLLLVVGVLVPVAAFMPTAVRVFENGYVPRVGFFVFHAVFFVWGCAASRVMLVRGSAARRALAIGWMPMVVIGCLCAVSMLRVLYPALHVKQNEPPPEVLGTKEQWRGGVMAAVSAVALVLGVVGVCERWVRGSTGPSPRAAMNLWHGIAHLGRGSMWVYVTHMPWVGVAVVAMFGLRAPGEVKACVAFAFALGMAVVTRRVFRGTRVGAWLGA